MLGRIRHVESVSEDRDRLAASVERAGMRGSVNPAGQPADDDNAEFGKLTAQTASNGQTAGCRVSGTDDGDGRRRERARIPGNPKNNRGIGDLSQ